MNLRLNHLVCWLAAFFVVLMSANTFAANRLHHFDMVVQDELTLYFDLEADQNFVNFTRLENPHRLAIDFYATQLDTDFSSNFFKQRLINRIRSSHHGENFLRVVLDLSQRVEATHQFIAHQGGQRLIVNIGSDSSKQGRQGQDTHSANHKLRDAIVVIDAGHGGKDPGAIGQRQTLEKDITLAVAKKLYDYLLKRPGVTPLLVRDSDVYVGLRERLNFTRDANADLFVSIHADAIHRRDAKGSSVYALSTDGATSEAAAWLARSENQSAELYGEVELDEMDDGLKKLLLNLAQQSTMEKSIEAGNEILTELKQIGNVHKPNVEQAAFAVLKSPDVPSVLVETAFISNLSEEKKLNSRSFQDELAKAIDRGIARFLIRRAPDGTLFAAQRQQQG